MATRPPQQLATALVNAQDCAIIFLAQAKAKSGGNKFHALIDSLTVELQTGLQITTTPHVILSEFAHDFPQVAIALIEYRTLRAVWSPA